MDAALFVSQMEELFELNAGSLSPSSVIKDIPGWGSLTFMGLISMVDEEYQVTLMPKAVLASETIADLMACIDGESPLRQSA